MQTIQQSVPTLQTDERCTCTTCGAPFADALAWAAHRPWKSRSSPRQVPMAEILVLVAIRMDAAAAGAEAIKAAEEGSPDAYQIVLDTCEYLRRTSAHAITSPPYAHERRVPTKKRRGGSDAGPDSARVLRSATAALADRFVIGVEARRAFMHRLAARAVRVGAARRKRGRMVNSTSSARRSSIRGRTPASQESAV